MKAYVERNEFNGKYSAVVQQDHQYFTIVADRPKTEAEWFVEMFHIALKKHDEERDLNTKSTPSTTSFGQMAAGERKTGISLDGGKTIHPKFEDD